MDAEWLGGVALQNGKQDQEGQFCAYVVDLNTLESRGSHTFATLDSALAAINALPREWDYVATTKCGEPGGCGGDCGTTCKKQCESE